MGGGLGYTLYYKCHDHCEWFNCLMNIKMQVLRDAGDMKKGIFANIPKDVIEYLCLVLDESDLSDETRRDVWFFNKHMTNHNQRVTRHENKGKLECYRTRNKIENSEPKFYGGD